MQAGEARGLLRWPAMEPHGWIALATLVVAAVLFLTRLVPLELTALAIPVVLFVTGTVPEPAEALSGFGNHAVLAIAAVFVLGAGLQESGVAALIARGVERVGGRSEGRLLVVVCLAIAALSAFMSNAAAVAVLLPAAIALARRAALPPSRLLMPLSFAAILGGNLTLIGTAPNLLVSDYLRHTTGAGFGMFDFAAVGLPIVLAGILFLVLFGRRLLPDHGRGRLALSAMPDRLAHDYGLSGRLTRLRVGRNSRLRGKTIAEAAIGSRYGVAVVAIEHHSGMSTRWLSPTPDYRMVRGDDLYLEGPEEAVWTLAEEESARIGLGTTEHADRVHDHGLVLAELAVAPRSPSVGQTLAELDFRRRYGMSVLSLWRRGGPVREDVGKLPLEVGDALLVAGRKERVAEVRRDEDFVLLTGLEDAHDFGKAPLALLCLAVALLPPLFGLAPLALSALAGAWLMAASGCVSMREAGRFVEWKVLALIVGTLPLGHALEVHGVADLAAHAVVGAAAGGGGPVVLAALFLVAAAVSITSSNAAAAVILAPVAARAAAEVGVEPRTALLAVAYGCSCAFLVPFAHQCNLMVMSPGGYGTRDFLRVGLPISLVVIVVAVGMLALV